MMKRSVHNMIWIIAVMSALFLQILVGVLNVWWYLPISLAVLHNGLALLILLLMVGWYHTVQKKVI